MTHLTGLLEAREAAKPKISYRPAEIEDIGFIVDTWVKSYRAGQPAGLAINGDIYHSQQTDLCTALAIRSLSTTVVAHTTGDPLDMVGYLVCGGLNKLFVHWVYVDAAYRHHGVASIMLSHLSGTIVFTHFSKIANKMFPDAIYNPYLVLLQLLSQPQAPAALAPSPVLTQDGVPFNAPN